MGGPAVGGRVVLTSMQNRQMGRKRGEINTVARWGGGGTNCSTDVAFYILLIKKVGLAW